MYRKHVRPKVFATIMAPATDTPLGAVLASAHTYDGGGKRVLEQLACDSALVLLDQLAITSASRGSDRETPSHR
jgi:hypothetical protein